MTTPRTIPAGPMPHDAILPLIREVSSLRERGNYEAAAEIEAAIRKPITVAGCVLHPDPDIDTWCWSLGTHSSWPDRSLLLNMSHSTWQVTMFTSTPLGPRLSVGGFGLTIAAALADARTRYQAAITEVLMCMGDLLREVSP